MKKADRKTKLVKAPKSGEKGGGKGGKIERGFRPTSDAKKAGKREKRLEGKDL